MLSLKCSKCKGEVRIRHGSKPYPKMLDAMWEILNKICDCNQKKN